MPKKYRTMMQRWYKNDEKVLNKSMQNQSIFWKSDFSKSMLFFQSQDAAEPRGRSNAQTGFSIILKLEPDYAKAYLGNIDVYMMFKLFLDVFLMISGCFFDCVRF